MSASPVIHVATRSALPEDQEGVQDVAATFGLEGERRAVVVCEGRGGPSVGDFAAQFALATLQEYLAERTALDLPQRILGGFQRVNDLLFQEATYQHAAGMATSVAVAIVDGNTAFAGWTGNVRVYYLRRGAIVRRSTDPTFPAAPALLGTTDPAMLQPVTPLVLNRPFSMGEGDVLLLCSEATMDAVQEWELPELLEEKTAAEAVDVLVTAALERGGVEDCAVALVLGGDRCPVAMSEPMAEPEVSRPAKTRRWRPGRRLRNLTRTVVITAVLAFVAAAALAVWYTRFRPRTPVEAIQDQLQAPAPSLLPPPIPPSKAAPPAPSR